MAIISGGSGWSEEFILWRLPLCRGYQYVHAHMAKMGVVTVRPYESVMKEMEEITRSFERCPRKR